MAVSRGPGPWGEPARAGGACEPLSPSARLARAALDLAGGALFVAGFLVLALTFLRWPILPFDEGVLLTGSMLVLQGKSLYRDFYSNYPPGIFLSIAGLWKLFGVSPMVLRFFGAGLHVGLALVAGRLAGRAGGRRFSFLSAGLTLAWLCLLMDVPYAWLAALLAALGFVGCLGAAAGSSGRGRWVAAGLALGALGCYRHDLLVYFGLGLAALAAGWMVRNRRLRPSDPILWRAAWGLGAAAALLGLVWIPTLVRAGVTTAAGDLYFDMVRYVLPSRVLPLPDVMRWIQAPAGLVLPAFAARPYEGAVALVLAGPLLGLLALLLVRRRERRLDVDLLMLTTLAVAVLPQLLGRSDVFHALFAVAPALILGAVLAERLALHGTLPVRVGAAWGLAALLALPVAFRLGPLLDLRPPPASGDLSRRYGGLPESSGPTAEARRTVLAFLDAHGRPADPVFVGCIDHRFALFSEMDLYFLANRTGATRYMQFDPGLIGREEVQAGMVRELEESRPAAAVLSRASTGTEPNASADAGATLLDDYLRSRYRAVGTAGPYLLLLRR